ncbi:MAG: hypothetical protein ACE5EK_04345, partial [Nitrospinales bacterium]
AARELDMQGMAAIAQHVSSLMNGGDENMGTLIRSCFSAIKSQVFNSQARLPEKNIFIGEKSLSPMPSF